MIKEQHKDFYNVPIEIGSRVVFLNRRRHELANGKVIGLCDKMVCVAYECNSPLGCGTFKVKSRTYVKPTDIVMLKD